MKWSGIWLAALLMSLNACTSEAQRVAPTAVSHPAPALAPHELAAATREIAGAPAPAGVDCRVWSQLQTELLRVLELRTGGRSGAAGFKQVSQVTQLSLLYFDSGSATLHWRYNLEGDYDQNSEVNIGDLTPLGVYWHASGPFFANAAEWLVDGDGNHEINLADVTPLGMFWGTRATGYNVYQTADPADFPELAAGRYGASKLAPLGFVPYAQHTETTGQLHEFTYLVASPSPGHYCWVRPTDGQTEGVPSQMVQLPSPPNASPQAALTALPLSGDAPLAVDFDASGSTDTDGTIAKYEWDWDGAVGGPSWFDSALDSTVPHVFDTAGSYSTIVRVTDDDGATDTATVTITVTLTGNEPPVAELTADPTSGPAPLVVNFDASGSTDPDNNIVKYEWDFEGDGAYELDTGATPTAQHTYAADGTRTAVVRVTDAGALNDTASVGINASGGPAEWHLTNLISFDEIKWLWLLEVGGRPAIAFADNQAAGAIFFLRGSDSVGSSWLTAVQVDSRGAEWIRLGIANGLPAVLYVSENLEMSYVQAQDADGTAWGTRQVGGSADIMVDMYAGAIINDCPAFAYSNMTDGWVYLRAMNSAGTSWASPVQINGVNQPGISFLEEIDGRPALAFSDFIGLLYVRANDANGASWPTPITLSDTEIPFYHLQLCIVNGNPALGYPDVALPTVNFVRANDALGATWPASQVLEGAHEGYGPTSLAVVNGKPYMSYIGGDPDQVFVRPATDANGSSWAARESIEQVDGTPLNRTCLAEINGHPAIAFVVWNDAWTEIHYAIYY